MTTVILAIRFSSSLIFFAFLFSSSIHPPTSLSLYIFIGMVIHPQNRQLYIAVPGKNQILQVAIDSGRFARTAREEYSIYSNRLPSFEYSIWECVDRSIYLENIDTPSGLAFSQDYERLFVAERGSGKIVVVDVATGAIITRIATQFTTIGGMEISPNGNELYFVDDITGTLNSITVQSECGSNGSAPIYASRTNPAFITDLNEAKLVLGMEDPFILDTSNSQQECSVDPIVPDTAFFDQVHEDSGYASENPDVQSVMAGMDAAAALLANRTDCGYDSELNFDALLLGGYYCHDCLPEQDLTCSGGGSCANIQWIGYICDNEFQIVNNNSNDPVNLPGRTYYRIQDMNGTDVDPSALVLKKNVEYRFQIDVDEKVCLSATSRPGDIFDVGATRDKSMHLGCSSRTDGPVLFTNTGRGKITGVEIYTPLQQTTYRNCMNKQSKFQKDPLKKKSITCNTVHKKKRRVRNNWCTKFEKVRTHCPSICSKECRRNNTLCKNHNHVDFQLSNDSSGGTYRCNTIIPKDKVKRIKICNRRTSLRTNRRHVRKICPKRCGVCSYDKSYSFE